MVNAELVTRGVGVALVAVSVSFHSVLYVKLLRDVRVRDPATLSRIPILTLTIVTGLLLVELQSEVLMLTLDFSWGINYRLIFPSLLAFVLGPQVLKMFALYFRFRLAEEVALKAQKNELLNSWFVQKRFLISNWFLAFAEAMWTILSFIVPLLFLLLLSGTKSPLIVNIWILIFCGIAAIVVIVIRVKINKREDAWGILKESRLSLILLIIGIVIWIGSFLLDMIDSLYIGYRFAISIVPLHIVYMAAALVSVRAQIYATAAADATLNPGSTVHESLVIEFQEVLSNSFWFGHFMQHCISELSSEQLSFIQIVIAFEKNLEDQSSRLQEHKTSLLAQVDAIVSAYIISGSLLEINIDWDTKTDILSRHKKLESIEDDLILLSELKIVFAEAQRQVKELLRTDSFMRFVKSEAYRNLAARELPKSPSAGASKTM